MHTKQDTNEVLFFRGLTQMYALNYRTAPVVRATGRLDDTFSHYNLRIGEGNGFKLSSDSPQPSL